MKYYFILIILCFTTCFALAQSPGDLVISEFMANPAAVSDTHGEYIELYNNTNLPIDINDFTLRDDGTNSHTIDNGGPLLVSAFDFIILGRDSNSTTNGGYIAGYQYSSFFLGNDDDEIVLETPGGIEICRLNYNNGDPFSAGVSAELDNVNNHVNGVIQESSYIAATAPYGAGDLGSPGSAGNTQGVAVSIDPVIKNELPKTFHFYQNFPNPFNPETVLRFDVPVSEKSVVDLTIYNILGQKVKTLFNGKLSAGTYETLWDGTSNENVISAGVYFAVLKSDNFQKSIKMVLIR